MVALPSEAPDLGELGFASRDRILRLARELLRDGPRDALNIVHMSEALSLSRRTIYNHCPSVDELYRQSRMQLVEEFAEHLPPMEAAEPEPSDGFLSDICALFMHDCHHELLLSLIRDGDREPWLADIYEERIIGPVARLTERWLGSLHRPSDRLKAVPARDGRALAEAARNIAVGARLHGAPASPRLGRPKAGAVLERLVAGR